MHAGGGGGVPNLPVNSDSDGGLECGAGTNIVFRVVPPASSSSFLALPRSLPTLRSTRRTTRSRGASASSRYAYSASSRCCASCATTASRRATCVRSSASSGVESGVERVRRGWWRTRRWVLRCWRKGQGSRGGGRRGRVLGGTGGAGAARACAAQIWHGRQAVAMVGACERRGRAAWYRPQGTSMSWWR
ncbi:hypothetical protein B0H12DRAFT_1158716 [Mycena haematopus]|nr:hypothetical protein B0H12DRAFT_1158716 [Mycena haematopus]